ncbi:MAG TPA: hypothetical protein VFI65_18825 [Streptosporangiaceae bacterium]|nr:hypothetical protein [Streptosporangiaceae bacterium]
MTDRTTFGDLARVVTERLNTAEWSQSSPASENPASTATRAYQFTYGVRRLPKVLKSYLADILTALEQPDREQAPASSPWPHAAREAQAAAYNVRKYLPLLADHVAARPEPRLTWLPSRELDDAVTAMAVARDLLQAHFETAADGTRRSNSQWEPFIGSPQAGRALLADLGAWARQIATIGAQLTLPAKRSGRPMTPDERRVAAVSHWLAALASTVEKAEQQSPVPAHVIRQLHAAPANVIEPRSEPALDDTVARLCHGAINSAERTHRAAAAAAGEDVRWSPSLSARSFRETASHAAIISHNCQILQQALAIRAKQYGLTELSRDLAISAASSARAKDAWLTANRAWRYITTDTQEKGISDAAIEASAMILWTGRLAYADPDWTRTLTTDHQPRQPRDLAVSPEQFGNVMAAIHQANAALTSLAAAEYSQFTAAFEAGRFWVPEAEQTSGPDGSPDVDTTFKLASRSTVRPLRIAYRHVGIASAEAAVRSAEIASELRKQNGWTATEANVAAQTAPHNLVPKLAPAALAAAHSEQSGHGPVTRALFELGVSDQDLLNRGVTIDQDVSQLFIQATQATGNQRWHAAVRRFADSHDIGRLLDDVVGSGDKNSAVTSRSHAKRRQSRSTQVKQEAMQAEP